MYSNNSHRLHIQGQQKTRDGRINGCLWIDSLTNYHVKIQILEINWQIQPDFDTLFSKVNRGLPLPILTFTFL